jgi:CRP-like cAMP-binding protein
MAQKNQRSGTSAFDAQTIYDVVKMMPTEMRVSLLKRVFGGAVLNNAFTRISTRSDREIVALLASTYLIREFYPNGETLYKYGETPKSLILNTSGTLSYVAVATERGGVSDPNIFCIEVSLSPYCCCVSGNFVGEAELIFPQPRLATVRAETDADVLVLPQRGFIVLVSSFPQYHDSLRRAVRRREGRRKSRLAQHKEAQTCQWLAALRLQSAIRMFMTRRHLSKGWRKARGSLQLMRGSLKSVVASKRNSEEATGPLQLPSQVPEKNTIVPEKNTAAPEKNKDDTTCIIAEAETLLKDSQMTPPPVSQVSTTPDSAPTAEGVDRQAEEKAAMDADQSKGSAKAPSNPSPPFPAGRPHALVPGSQAYLPPWSIDLKMNMRKMDANIGELNKRQEEMRKGQEEMQGMLQHIYFLLFSSDEKTAAPES